RSQHGRRLARDGEPHPQGPLRSRLHLHRVESDHHHQQGAAAIAVTTAKLPASSPRLGRVLREAAWFVRLAAGAYLALVLATYHRGDPGPSFSGTGAPIV